MLARLCTLAFALLFALAATSSIATATTGAAFTTVNENADGTGHCKNGNPNVNCNIYEGKQYVWLSGGPLTAAVNDGTYFFAVLVPGGQADPNDGADKNLSDDFDAYTNRTFTMSGGTISYAGTHDFDSNKIRLMPYADTTNPGGEYILAICQIVGDNGYPVDPSTCKYDAFKVAAQTALPLTATKTATPSFTRTFKWDISKSADKTELDIASGGEATFNYTVAVTHDAGTDSGWTVTGAVVVTNPNAAAATVTITDAIDDANATCSLAGGPTFSAPSGSTGFAYTCSYSAAPAAPQQTNTATISWDDQVVDGGFLAAGSTTATAAVAWGAPTTIVDGTVAVNDSLVGSLGTVSSTDASPKTFTYSRTFTGDPAGTCTSHDNTATFTTNTSGSTGSASQTVKVCVGADPTVTKTITTSFTRTYNWQISKLVDKTAVKQIGGTATFNYTVAASEAGFTDSGWAATGLITITNLNDWEAINATVGDTTDNGGTCTVAGGGVANVPASGSVNLSYTCAFPSGAAGTNTATATWDKTAYFTPSGSASGTAAIAFGAPTTTANKTVTITDTFGTTTTTLGTLTATDTTPFASATYTYSRTLNVPASDCVTYPNTAKITETGQSASQSVRVCGPEKTGALTMGFWQNKNGQGIIAGGASTSGVCNAATWLRQFAPYQDLSATATCAQTATYAFNIIKSANSSGTSMNPMLKAQMLATALDVFFSDPALGGNKIGQYNGLGSSQPAIGGLSIDLTMICAMIDGSGTGTCSGSFQNVSSAFGGATSMTVSQMLAYASSQANLGGSTWYGNVKSTQELAKNAFDAINNQVAFAP